MPESNWYCADCGTHGGGPPNNMTMQEHIDYAHAGGVARMVEGDWKDWKRRS